MKIICIGHNYAAHNKEMASNLAKPAIFIKPDTALVQQDRCVYIPDFTEDLQHEIELVLRICKVGKSISRQFAPRYYNEIGLGIDFTARDLQRKCKDAGEPWEISKAFDNSAPISSVFIPVSEIADISNIEFSLHKNGFAQQVGNSKDMIISFDEIIEYVSSFFTLKIGDLIFTGTPAGVSRVDIGDILEGYFGEQKILNVQMK